MFIHFRKYKEPDGTVKNYFDNPTKVDEFYTQEIFEEGFPEYSESMHVDNNFFQVQYDKFSFKFSLQETVLSDLGKNIKEFIKPYYHFNAKIAVRINTVEKDVFGIVDMSSIQVDYTFIQGKYEISFNCWGADKEFNDWNGSPLPVAPLPPGGRIYLLGLILNFLFLSIPDDDDEQHGPPAYFNVINNLDWEGTLGWEEPPWLMWEIWNNILIILAQGGYALNTGLEYLGGIAIGLGFTYDFFLSDDQGNPDYFKINFILFWRKKSAKNWTINEVSSDKEVCYLDTSSILLMSYIRPATQDNNRFVNGGALLTENYSFINDCEDAIGPFEGNIMRIQPTDDPHRVKFEGKRKPDPQYQKISMRKIKYVELTKFQTHTTDKEFFFAGKFHKADGNPYFYALALSRLFVKSYTIVPYPGGLPNQFLVSDEGWLELLQNAINNYPFLTVGERTVVEIITSFEDGAASRGDSFTFKGHDYFLEEIKKMNLYNKTYQLRGINIDENIPPA